MATITSANSEFIIRVPDVFAVDQPLQGFATDDAFSSEDVSPAEVKMGVDGVMSGGFTPFPTKMLIHFQADSPSIQTFTDWLQAMEAVRETFIANGVIQLPAVGKIITLTKGILTRAKKIPDVKKLLDPQTFEITWQTVSVSIE